MLQRKRLQHTDFLRVLELHIRGTIRLIETFLHYFVYNQIIKYLCCNKNSILTGYVEYMRKYSITVFLVQGRRKTTKKY